ncbi:MAG: hypothetical protein K2V38_27925 [Gemmataceae bacterium]|nr:hypothetical protein [Gemmataceae bacterium]
MAKPNHNFYPTADQLSESDIARLRALTPNDLRIRIRYQFTDDQDQCMDVDVNGVEIALKWISSYSAAAFYFTEDSPKARAEVVRVIQKELDFHLQNKEESDA